MEKPEFSEGKPNPFEVNLPAFRDFRADRGTIQSGFGGRRQTKAALALMQEHHKNVMEHLDRSYQLEAGFQSHKANLAETAAQGTHGRSMEAFTTANKFAQGGKAVSFSIGDMSANYTKAKPRTKKTKSSVPNRGNFSPVRMPEEPQMEAPATPAATPTKKTQKYAQRDPKTGKISGYAETPQKPIPKKKATPRKSK